MSSPTTKRLMAGRYNQSFDVCTCQEMKNDKIIHSNNMIDNKDGDYGQVKQGIFDELLWRYSGGG